MSTLMSLLDLRTAIRQRADMQNSTFVSDIELNSYINQSAFELYDLLTTVYEMYYAAPPLQFQSDGVSRQYPLPDGVLYNGAPAFYKLLGVDLGLTQSFNANITLRRFEFIERNRFIFPQLASSFLGVFNVAYDIVGNTIMFIPTPQAGQFFTLWYQPVFQTLVNDSDLLNGISGWTEYIICDGAIKCANKEETDATLLMAQKMALKQRIEESSINRDIGQPQTISDTRSQSGRFGGRGYGWDGGFGGF
jgi:hypothetical protein